MKSAKDILVTESNSINSPRVTLADRLRDIREDYDKNEKEILALKRELGLIVEEENPKVRTSTRILISNSFFSRFPRVRTIAERISDIEKGVKKSNQIQNLILKHLGLEFTTIVKDQKDVSQKVKSAKKKR